MSNQPRVFKLPSKPKQGKKPEPLMRGKDIEAWQRDVKKLFDQMGIRCPIVIDGIYAQQSRGFSAALVHAMGLSVQKAMAKGVTPELRIKLRNRDLTKTQVEVKNSKARKEYRAKLREQWKVKKVHPLVNKVTVDSWGFSKFGHDGVDVNTAKMNLPVYAMVKCKVVRVSADDWWGANPTGDVSKGDGIVILEILETVGPFKKGDRLGYGHVEHARVKEGEIVEAGEVVALVGLAVTPHVHLMVNHGPKDKYRDGRLVGTRGVGTFDPRPLHDYAVKNG